MPSKKLHPTAFLTDFWYILGPGGLEGLRLDEIEAANSFLMLPMARPKLKMAHVELIFQGAAFDLQGAQGLAPRDFYVKNRDFYYVLKSR